MLNTLYIISYFNQHQNSSMKSTSYMIIKILNEINKLSKTKTGHFESSGWTKQMGLKFFHIFNDMISYILTVDHHHILMV